MKKWIIVIAIIILILAIIGIFYYMNNTANNSNNYHAEKTATETNNSTQNQEATEANQPQNPEVTNPPQPAPAPAQVPTEAEELASFSTKIYTKDSSRQNNITITCSNLNDTDIANGETFSFCNTVGRSSPSKGYTKADIFTDGKKTKGYGGRKLSSKYYALQCCFKSTQFTSYRKT